jgi:UrcA family protein
MNSSKQIRVVRPKITLAMIICGAVAAVGIGAANAATADGDGLRTKVTYRSQDLATPEATRALYRKLVRAAEDVCPADTSSPHLLSPAVRECREQSIARAVFKINNPSLVALYTSDTKHG